MEGFVRNEGGRPVFILQRSILPGQKISFEDAYKVVGTKSKKRRGKAFVQWLREKVFADAVWGFYKSDGEKFFAEEIFATEASKGGKGSGINMSRRSEALQKKEQAVEQIIISPYVIAKELIEKCKEREVLKKALALSKRITGKEAHMRHLIRRLEQVY